VRATGAAVASLRFDACESGEGPAVIHIAIGAMPPLLRSIVRSALETEADMAVMAPPAGEGGRAGPGAGEADVLIVCSDRESEHRIAVRQLAATDAPVLVAIDSEGTCATILRVTAERTPIGAASDLCEAIRLAAHRRSRTTN
jgi:hypothetical protein